MERGWKGRFLFVCAVLGLAAYTMYPTIYYYWGASEEEKSSHEKFCAALPSGFSCTKINLGLDLQGGVHLVMGVGVDQAVSQRLDRIADTLNEAFTRQGVEDVNVRRPRKEDVILLEGSGIEAALGVIGRDFTVLTETSSGESGRAFRLISQEETNVRDTAVEQTIKAIRNRADRFGVTEPSIARRGATNIVIQLPGVKDPDRALAMIGKTAQLEFKMVDAAGTAGFSSLDASMLPASATLKNYTFEGQGGKPSTDFYYEFKTIDKDAIRTALESLIPSDSELTFGTTDQEGVLRTYVLEAKAGITGDYLIDATVDRNPELPTDYEVSMQFDPKGARIFEKLTEKSVGRLMAIVLDDVVSSAPRIQTKIPGGRARITLGGGYGNPNAKLAEATDLVQVLKAGALPAPVEVREKREVGQTLGEQSVIDGRNAILFGSLLVFIFMFIYYKASGIVANIALLANVVLVAAVLALFEATLTLPGMAGIVLTIGMAVDANVIIFERIREEIRAGKTPGAAIDSGYEKAFSTIMDANITTFIAGVVLLQYGTGPVRGFAVTLMVGIVCSVFTAIYVTRLVFDAYVSGKRLKSLSI